MRTKKTLVDGQQIRWLALSGRVAFCMFDDFKKCFFCGGIKGNRGGIVIVYKPLEEGEQHKPESYYVDTGWGVRYKVVEK